MEYKIGDLVLIIYYDIKFIRYILDIRFCWHGETEFKVKYDKFNWIWIKEDNIKQVSSLKYKKLKEQL